MSWNKYLNQQNVLISKDDIGKSRPPPYKLENPDFAYGKQDIKDREGVKESNIAS